MLPFMRSYKNERTQHQISNSSNNHKNIHLIFNNFNIFIALTQKQIYASNAYPCYSNNVVEEYAHDIVCSFYICIPLWKWLFDGIVLSNKKLYDCTPTKM